MKKDGTACDDGDSSTSNDRCFSGTCTGTVTCGSSSCSAASPQCQTSACSSAGKCVDVQKADGIFCNDGNVTTVGDTCIGGVCVGQPSPCVPNPCGSSQICTTSGSTFQCTCKSPLAGFGSSAPATCRSKNSGCTARPSFCEQVGQRCTSRPSGEWVCFCAPPLVGALAGGKATCAEKNVTDVLPLQPPDGADPQQWALDLADRLGAGPSRILVEENVTQGTFDVSFHGAPIPSGGSQLDPLTSTQLFSEFQKQNVRCNTTTTTFCKDLNITSINYAAASCVALTVETTCTQKDTCEWEDNTCSDNSDSDDDFPLWHLFWIIPLVLILICLAILGVAKCLFGKKKNGPTDDNLVHAKDLPYEDMERLAEGESARSSMMGTMGPKTPPQEFLPTSERTPTVHPLTFYDTPPTGVIAGPYPVGTLSKTGDGHVYGHDLAGAYLDDPYVDHVSRQYSAPRHVRPSDEQHPQRYGYSPEPLYGSGRAQGPPPPIPPALSAARGPGLYPVKC